MRTLRHLVRRVRFALLLTLAGCLPTLAQSAPAPTNFLNPSIIKTASWPYTLYAGDFDGDGNQDILYLQPIAGAAAGQPDTQVNIIYGDGTGRFSAPVAQGTLTSAGSLVVTVADMDGDGLSDFSYVQGPVSPARQSSIATWFGSPQRTLRVTSPATSTWLLGNGRFTGLVAIDIPLTIGAPKKELSLIALEAADASRNVIYGDVLRSNGAGLYQPVFEIQLPDGAGPAITTDLNGDGQPDLIVLGSANHSVDVFLSQSDDYFSSALHFNAPYPISSILVQDVDNDARPDLITEGANGRFDIFHGNGDGTFQTTSEGGSLTLDGRSGNGGHLIAETTVSSGVRRNFYTATPAGISVLTGNGNLTYTLAGIFNAGPGRTSYAFADFNHDGYPDLALDSPEGIALLFGKADGTFTASQAFAAGAPATSSVLGAFTSGKLPDAVVATAATQAQLLRNNGDGTFTAAAAPTTPQTGTPNLIASLQSGDFNGDGHLDLALTADGPHASLPYPPSTTTGIAIQFGDGTGAFTAPIFPTAQAQFTTPDPSTCNPPFDHFPNLFFGTSALADFNSDGLADLANRDATAYRILRGNFSSSPQTATAPTLFYSTVDGSQTGTTVDCGLHAHDLVVAGDLNNDGRPDLLFQGQGTRTGALQIYTTHAMAAPTLLGDLSLDGSQPGSLITPGQLTAPALNPFNGAAVPTSAGGLGFPAFPGSGVVADLDGDGFNDLIVTYTNLSASLAAPTPSAPNAIYIWFGSGQGQFFTSARHPVNPVVLTPARNFYQAAVADLNGDSIPDLILSDGSILSIQYGVGDGTFGPEQHLLAGQGINSLSVADVNGDGRPDLVLANGGTLLANPVANLDTLTPNPDVSTGGITVLLNQGASTPVSTATGSLTASPEPSAFEAAYTLTAALITTSAPPTGITATFTTDARTQGTVALQTASASNSTASLAIPAVQKTTTCAAATTSPWLAPGTHTLGATFSALYNPLTGTHTISLGPTTTALTPSTPLTTPYGTPINGTFVVMPVDNACTTTGTYTVYDNGVPATGCVNLPLSTSCPYGDPQLLDAGNHTLSVTYNGGPANNDPINASSSSNAVAFVITPDSTAATVISSRNPATVGTAVTFTAALTGSVVTPVGTVQFFDNGTLLGTGTLNAAGIASFTTSALAVGTHPITVVYAGNQDFNASTSAILNQVIVAAALPVPSATLVSSLNPALVGTAVTFTATVSSTAGLPSGSVQFLDNGTLLGTGALSANGTATFTISTLTLGLHPINVSYTGNASFAPAISPIVLQSIIAAAAPPPSGFTLTVAPNPVTLGVGRTALLSITVTPTGSFAQPVQLGCSGLPSEATCAFVLGTLPATGGTTTLQLTAGSPHPCSTTGEPYYPPSLAALFLISLTGAGFTRSRRLLRNLLLLVASLVTLPLLTACGGACTDLGTYPGSYSFTVTATAQGTPVTLTQTATVAMKVTLQ